MPTTAERGATNPDFKASAKTGSDSYRHHLELRASSAVSLHCRERAAATECLLPGITDVYPAGESVEIIMIDASPQDLATN